MDILPQHELIFSAATIFGMIGHYAKKKVRSETQVTLYQWFGSINVFGTVASLTTAAIAIFGALSNNVVTADMSIATLVYIGLTTGYTIDSTTNGDDTEINRGLQPPKWLKSPQ